MELRLQDGAPASDLPGGGLDHLLAGGPPEPTAAAAYNSLLCDIFGMGGAAHAGYVPTKHVWLSAQKEKGLNQTNQFIDKVNKQTSHLILNLLLLTYALCMSVIYICDKLRMFQRFYT